MMSIPVSVTLLLHASALAPADAPSPPAARPSILFAIADDWSWPHAGVYGDKVVRTPTFDRLAREGVLFTHAFCASPSCTPSRGAILTGQAIHRLEDGGNLWSTLPSRFQVYPDLLEAAGYAVGFTGKGWGPGDFKAGGRTRNPAGPAFQSFQKFLDTVKPGQPFCFWFGSHDPHRPYEKGSGANAGMRIENVVVPPFLPDTREVRSDILDYYFEVQRFDRDAGELIRELEASGRLDNTLIVMTSDNGMPFPRAKANLYDSGTRMPLAIGWRGKIEGGRMVDDLVSLADVAPTFLEAAGVKVPASMTGRSLLPLLTGERTEPNAPRKQAPSGVGARPGRETVFIERERHANVRWGDLSYPSRAVRTKEFLYIRNLRPDRWPAGDPKMYKAVGPFGDIDGSPSKDLLLARHDDPEIAAFFRLACDKRPAEELYDLSKDPWHLNNTAAKPEYAEAKKKLRVVLDQWMKDTADPMLRAKDDPWDHYPYYGRDVPKSR
jgi:N-sulfoglucosamine sulfohydrolase